MPNNVSDQIVQPRTVLETVLKPHSGKVQCAGMRNLFNCRRIPDQ
jgi:hypothetical protein